MAGEVQQVSQEVDRAHHRREEAADAQFRGNVASLECVDHVDHEGCVDHAHGDVALEAEPEEEESASVRATRAPGMMTRVMWSSRVM